jgi:glucose-6-phosphate isomerase
MSNSKLDLWQRFQKYYTEFPRIGLALDLSRMNFPDSFFQKMEQPMRQAFAAMAELERGAIANPNENRMVGHYWLRNPALAPSSDIRKEIEDTVIAIKAFAAQVHAGTVRGNTGAFKNILLIGIGGSALGPQFAAHALGDPATDKLKLFCFDNTDPDGIDKVLAQLGSSLGQTMCIVISKSGGTKETRNGMLEAEAAYRKAGLNFGSHTIGITMNGSELHKHALANGWLKLFPMWDWVGGRTSQLSAVGLLPAALQGLDIDNLLSGAHACDELTRKPVVSENPAALLALMWFHAGSGRGEKNLIVLPYKDRLELFSKYLQQLIMESLGKELDLDGKQVNQGLTVLGNKGSTDQHSFIQQLREGMNDFFVTFIRVLQDRKGKSLEVEPAVTAGDFLDGFYQGTRRALHDNGRESITITIGQLSAFSVGVLIALFERTVGLYARLININAYHQPGVEAGKKAAATVIALQNRVVECLKQEKRALSPAEIGELIEAPEEVESIFLICEHLAANPDRAIRKALGSSPFNARYSCAAR